MSNDERINEMNQIMTVTRHTEAKTSPTDEADVLVTFESGSPMLVVGETTSGWYQISYRGEYGYVKKETSELETFDATGLNEEMTQNEAESQMMVEEVERYREDVKNSHLWAGVIALLVIGIFVAGFFSVKGTKKVIHKKDFDVIDLDEEEDTNETDHTDPML